MSGGMEDMCAYSGQFKDKLTQALEDAKYAAPYSSHYKGLVPEPIDVIERWGLNFNLGNALKYIARAEHKGQKHEDLAKAIWYLKRELAMCKD
jgi:hypothetical protein